MVVDFSIVGRTHKVIPTFPSQLLKGLNWRWSNWTRKKDLLHLFVPAFFLPCINFVKDVILLLVSQGIQISWQLHSCWKFIWMIGCIELTVLSLSSQMLPHNIVIGIFQALWKGFKVIQMYMHHMFVVQLSIGGEMWGNITHCLIYSRVKLH